MFFSVFPFDDQRAVQVLAALRREVDPLVPDRVGDGGVDLVRRFGLRVRADLRPRDLAGAAAHDEQIAPFQFGDVKEFPDRSFHLFVNRFHFVFLQIRIFRKS